MKFSCLQENLSKGLGIVSKAVPLKSSLPYLSNVLITAKDGRLRLAATNLETAITAYVGASVEQEGEITIPAKLISEFVSNLSPGTIEAELKDDILHLTAGKTKSKFNGMSPDDFPEMPVMPEEKDHPVLSLEPEIFSSLVSSVAFAASADGSRPILSGVYLNFSKGLLTVAATDGFRLSERAMTLKEKAKDFTVVIPAKTLLDVAKIFGSSPEPIKFLLNESENRALFESDGVLVSTGVLDGNFPDYKRIIPDANSLVAKFSAASLLEAVRLTNVFAKEMNSVVRLIFDPEGVLKVTSSSEETGENNSEIEAEIEGDTFEIAFNSKYLLDFLNNIKTELIVFESNGAVAPGVMRTDAIEGYIHLVMPVRVQS